MWNRNHITSSQDSSDKWFDRPDRRSQCVNCNYAYTQQVKQKKIAGQRYYIYFRVSLFVLFIFGRWISAFVDRKTAKWWISCACVKQLYENSFCISHSNSTGIGISASYLVPSLPLSLSHLISLIFCGKPNLSSSIPRNVSWVVNSNGCKRTVMNSSTSSTILNSRCFCSSMCGKTSAHVCHFYYLVCSS